jgi:anti-anti-sigma factor
LPRRHVYSERIPDPPTWIIGLEGEHDLATSRSVADAIERALEDGDAVVVDLSRVTFAESAILGVLLDARQRAPERRFAVVVRPGSQPDRLFDLVDARSIVRIFAARDAAVEWCRPGIPDLRLDEPA